MPYLGVKPADEFTSKDLNGEELILDADADTTITADTDDQIDIRIAGADDFQFTANTFTAQSGSTIAAQALTATLITPSLPISYSNETGISAGATQTQAGATALTKEFNTVTVVGTNGDGVKLPTAAAGLKVRIYNADAGQYLNVWPNTSDAIDGGSADAVDVNAILFGGFREYVAYDATNWVTTSQSAMFETGTLVRDMATATGDQSITGIGFKPNHGFWLAGSNVDFQESIGITAGGLNGAGDIVWRNITNVQAANAVYANTHSATVTAMASFMESGVGGWTHGMAKLKTWDSDGFTLTWTNTGSHSGTGTIAYMVSRI